MINIVKYKQVDKLININDKFDRKHGGVKAIFFFKQKEEEEAEEEERKKLYALLFLCIWA